MDNATQDQVNKIKAEAESQTEEAVREENAQLENLAEDVEEQSEADAAKIRQNEQAV